MVHDVFQTALRDVKWVELNYPTVDMPPATSDAQMTFVQLLPVAGVAVLTTKQPVWADDAR